MNHPTRQAIVRWAAGMLLALVTGYVGAYLALGERDGLGTIEFQSPNTITAFVPLAAIEAGAMRRQVVLKYESGPFEEGQRVTFWECDPFSSPRRSEYEITSINWQH